MWAEVISIGDELTSGQRLDTNCQWLSQQLSDLGMSVLAHRTIGDYLEPMVTAFRQAAAEAQLIVVTGGLGPTQDDLTRTALAQAFDKPLVFDPASWEHIRQLFRRRGVNPPENNRQQAWFPAGSRTIPNPHGSAPGIDWTLDVGGRGVRFICLPGVPAEMREMFQETVVPRLRSGADGAAQVICRRVIKTFGAGESHLEQQLPDLIRRGNDPQVGITASQGTISLRLQTTAADPAAADRKLQPVVDTIYRLLGNLVFGEDSAELEDVVSELLFRQSQRLAVVEWGTRGLVSQWLDEALQRLPGAAEDRSQFGFQGAVVLTHPAAVSRWLEPDALLDPTGDGSLAEVVGHLAAVAAHRFQADWTLAGGPLPNPAGPTDPPPFYLTAVQRSPDGLAFFPARFAVVGHTSLWRPRAAKQMLNHLRLLLLDRHRG